MRFSSLLTFASIAVAACGPTYVVQSPPQPAPQRVPVPPRVEPLGVNIVRPEDGRVLIQTSRPAYVAVFEIVPGRGVSLVYPRPYQPRDVTLTGLSWVDVSWTLGPSYDRRLASEDTRYIYVVASDTPLQISDADYDRWYLERQLGAAFWSSSPNVTVRAISREIVRSQPDEWWGEDMYSMPLARDPRVTLTIRLARVYCPDGVYFDVRDDLAGNIWCPARSARPGERPIPMQPDSVFASNGRRLPRHVDPSARTPIFRVPGSVDVGQQQGEPRPPRNPVPFPRRDPGAQMPPANQPAQNQPPQVQPPQTQPPQNQPPQNQPPQNPPPQTQPQTPPQNQPGQTQPGGQNAGNGGQDNNGRRAHGDPRNADPRGDGNGYGNGGRQQPTTQSPATTPPQSNPGNSGQTGNNGSSADHGNGKGPDNSKPNHNETQAPTSKSGVSAILRSRAPQGQKQDEKKADSDSTAKKKP